MKIQQAGNWTIYIAPEWEQQKYPVSISSLAVAADGSIWFGTIGGPASTGTGVYRFDGRTWRRYTSQNSGLPFDEVSSIAASPNDKIWFTTLCCGVSQFDGETWKTYTTADGLAENDTRSSVVAPDGSVWIGTEDKGVLRFDGKNWSNYTDQNGLMANFVGNIAVLADQSLLFSVSNSRNLVGLNRYDKKEWGVFSAPEELSRTYTFDVASTPNGTLWFATEKDGVFRFSSGSWVNYTTKDALASNSVLCAVAASDDSVWFCTDKGISHFDGKNWETFTTKNGLTNNWIVSAARGSNGTLWFGSASAIYRYQPSKRK